VDALRERVPLHQLLSFAAWNTAGNTLGTVLAQCAAQAAAPRRQPLLNTQFLLARLIDDWGYQAVVRPDIERRAREQFGASPLRLDDAWKPCEAIVKEQLGELARALFDQHFYHQVTGAEELRCNVSLPWGRTFEVDVEVEFAKRET
jgi:hypothetical protein